MGFPQYGIKGAAIASILAEISYILVAYGYIYFKKYHILYQFQLKSFIDIQLSKETLTIAFPVMLQFFFSIASWELFYIFIEHLGKNELAISQILRSVFGVVGVGSWALGSSCNSLVSNFIGQNRHNEVLGLIGKIVSLSLPLAFILGCILLLFPYQFIGIYTNDPELIKQAYWPLIVVVVANSLLAIATVVFNGALGTGNTKVNMLIEFAAITVYIIYIYFVIEKMRLGLAWAWGSEFLYWLVLLGLSFGYLKFGNWRAKKI
jgi:multidrug resistance protein, MATE family